MRSVHYVTWITSKPAAPSLGVRLLSSRALPVGYLLLGLALSIAALPLAAGAQQPTDTLIRAGNYTPDALSTGQFASRASLEQIARGTGPAADVARERLADGDFQVGDRIALNVVGVGGGEAALTDTFTVREGQLLRLPNITPDVQLHGVLHAELQDVLTKDLAQYIKDPVVHATPLLRLAVLGQVPRPGYYSIAADELTTSLVMHAGGLLSSSDLGKTVVKRGTDHGPETVYTSKQLQAAMASGETVDQLALHQGDEIVVGERSGGFPRYLGYFAILAGIGASIAFIVTR